MVDMVELTTSVEFRAIGFLRDFLVLNTNRCYLYRSVTKKGEHRWPLHETELYKKSRNPRLDKNDIIVH